MPFFSFEIHNILFYIITILWNLEFVIFRSKFKGSNYSDKQSFKTILIVIVTIIAGTIGYNLLGLFTVPSFTYIYFNYGGISLYIIGILLRYTASMTLGRYFTRDVEVSSNQELISHGPYKLLAHPLYLGLFLLVLAVPVYFGQIIWIFGAIFFFGRVILNRMNSEEKALEASLGDTYVKWRSKRYRFIPWVY
jgi:protein-S-isoprenylcysteine O-methyltransferase Ste14